MQHFSFPQPAPSFGPADSDTFRAAMRNFAGTVSAVTFGNGEDRSGFAATSVCSLSVEPPTVLVCLDRSSSSWPAIRQQAAFGVNVLSQEQAAVADRLAGREGMKGAARYAGASWRTLATGAPILDDALLAFDCRLEEAIERHSHAILIGRVEAILTNGGLPLIYQHGSYRRLSP